MNRAIRIIYSVIILAYVIIICVINYEKTTYYDLGLCLANNTIEWNYLTTLVTEEGNELYYNNLSSNEEIYKSGKKIVIAGLEDNISKIVYTVDKNCIVKIMGISIEFDDHVNYMISIHELEESIVYQNCSVDYSDSGLKVSFNPESEGDVAAIRIDGLDVIIESFIIEHNREIFLNTGFHLFYAIVIYGLGLFLSRKNNKCYGRLICALLSAAMTFYNNPYSYLRLVIMVIGYNIFFLLIYEAFKRSIKTDSKISFVISGIGLLIFFPLIYSKYLFGDEFWTVGFGSLANSRDTNILVFGRAFQSVLNSANVNNLWFFRLLQGLQVVTFAQFIFYFFSKISHNKTLSSFLAIIISYGSWIIDVAAYSSIFTFIIGVNLISYIYILIYELCDRHKILSGIIGIIGVFLACHMYQLTLPLMFFYIASEVVFVEKMIDKKRILRFVNNIVNLFLGMGLYYTSIRIFGPGNPRGQTIKAVEIGGKLVWFCGTVLKNSVSRIYAGIVYGNAFLEKIYWAGLRYQNINTWYYIITCLGILVIAYTALFFKERKVNVLIAFILLPATYFVNLIIHEDSYQTYYALPLIATILLYIVVMIYRLMCKINIKNFNIVACCIVLLLIVNSSKYLYEAYVRPFGQILDFIEYSIKGQEDAQMIYLYNGRSFWGGQPSYGTNAARRALEYLGKTEADYYIVASDYKDDWSRFYNPHYFEIYNNSSALEKEYLNKAIDTTNGVLFTINEGFYNDYTLELLRELYIIPEENASIVETDLSWVEYQFV